MVVHAMPSRVRSAPAFIAPSELTWKARGDRTTLRPCPSVLSQGCRGVRAHTWATLWSVGTQSMGRDRSLRSSCPTSQVSPPSILRCHCSVPPPVCHTRPILLNYAAFCSRLRGNVALLAAWLRRLRPAEHEKHRLRSGKGFGALRTQWAVVLWVIRWTDCPRRRHQRSTAPLCRPHMLPVLGAVY
jgi:hypothetical protein